MPFWSHSYGTRSRGAANTHCVDFERPTPQWAKRDVGDVAGINMTGNRSVECWVKLDQALATNEVWAIAGWWSNVHTWRNWCFYFQDFGGTPYLLTIMADAVGYQRQVIALATLGITATDWNHLAWTCDISALQAIEHTYYANGVDKGHGIVSVSREMAATQQASAGSFCVGTMGEEYYSFEMDGRVDDLRVWDDIRTGSEIQDNMSVELVGNEANLQGYWKFNDAWTDETANANTLTPQRAPTFPADPAF